MIEGQYSCFLSNFEFFSNSAAIFGAKNSLSHLPHLEMFNRAHQKPWIRKITSTSFIFVSISDQLRVFGVDIS